MQSINFKIEGLTCDDCVNKIEETLTQTNGVSNVKVDLNSQAAALDFDEETIDLKAIGKIIEDAGFEAVF